MVLVFIGGVGAAAVYVARRPTIASGQVLGARLLEANQATVKTMECDDAPIGVDGAHFSCKAIFKDGSSSVVQFAMDRTGAMQPAGEPTSEKPRVKQTTDPWGD